MKLKDINLKNVKAFLQAHYRIAIEDSLPEHIKEQVIWRASQAEACTKNGKCLYCGCSTEDLELYYADIGCKKPDNPCYPDMMTKEQWDEYKHTNQIQA
jgi:hypothetical protein